MSLRAGSSHFFRFSTASQVKRLLTTKHSSPAVAMTCFPHVKVPIPNLNKDGKDVDKIKKYTLEIIQQNHHAIKSIQNEFTAHIVGYRGVCFSESIPLLLNFNDQCEAYSEVYVSNNEASADCFGHVRFLVLSKKNDYTVNFTSGNSQQVLGRFCFIPVSVSDVFHSIQEKDLAALRQDREEAIQWYRWGAVYE